MDTTIGTAEEEVTKMLALAEAAAAKTQTFNNETTASRALVEMFYAGRNRIEAAGILTDMSKALQDIEDAKCTVDTYTNPGELKNLFKTLIILEAVSAGSEVGASRKKKRKLKGGAGIFDRILSLFSSICAGVKNMTDRVDRILQADVRALEAQVESTANDDALAKKIAGYIRSITMTILSMVAIKVLSNELSLGTSGIVGIVSRYVLNGVLALIPENTLEAIPGTIAIIGTLGGDIVGDVTDNPKKYAAFAAAAALSLPFTQKGRETLSSGVTLGKSILANLKQILVGNASASILDNPDVVASVEALTEALEGLQTQPGAVTTRSQVAAAAEAAKAAADVVLKAAVAEAPVEAAAGNGAAGVKAAIKTIDKAKLQQLRARYKEDFRRRIEAAAEKAVADAVAAEEMRTIEAAKAAAAEPVPEEAAEEPGAGTGLRKRPAPEEEAEAEARRKRAARERSAMSSGVPEKDEAEDEAEVAETLTDMADKAGMDGKGRKRRNTQKLRKRRSFKKNKRRYSKKRINRR